MKKLLIIPVAALCGFIVFQAFTGVVLQSAQEPADAGEILAASCFDCHSNASKNDKPRDALNFDLWDSYGAGEKLSLLGDICEVVEKKEMPPTKYLNRNPHKSLSEDAAGLICAWTVSEGEKILGGE